MNQVLLGTLKRQQSLLAVNLILGKPMVISVVALMGVLVLNRQLPAEEPLIIQTLDVAIKNVFPDPAYAIEFSQELQDAPVVYSISRRTDPKTDLKNFCQALFLETEFDEQKRKVKIKKGQFLFRNDRKDQIAKSLNNLRDQIKSFVNLDPKQIHLRKLNFDKILASETNPVERDSLRAQIDTMELLLGTPSVVLLLSLLGNEAMPSILAEPCSKTNHGTITAEASPYLSQYLAGNGTDFWDFYRPEDIDPQSFKAIRTNSNSRREKALAVGQKAPIPFLRHEIYTRDLQVGLYFITPDFLESGASMDISTGEFQLGTISNVPSTALTNPMVLKPLWDSENYTINSLGAMANEMKVNFASWLSPVRMWTQARQNFATNQKAFSGLSASLDHDWLSIYDAKRPMTLITKAWRKFFKLREMFESKPVHRKDLLTYVSSFSDSDLNRLEDLGSNFAAMPKKYFVLTSGIRLFRAYLTCLDTRPGNAFDGKIPYELLPKMAKADYIGFFSSAYVWTNFPHLFHPVNKAKIPSTTLNISYDPSSESESHNAIQILFPEDQNPLKLSGPMIFPVPTKFMAP